MTELSKPDREGQLRPGPHVHPAAAGSERIILFGILLNSGFVAVEVVAGLLTRSMSLLADAGHNLSDVVALGLAWAAAWLVRRRSTRRFTYGFKRGSILIALANVMLLLFALGVITLEAVRRLGRPVPVDALAVVIVAGAGILVNGFTAVLLRRGGQRDINVRAAYWHMASDALVSLAVVAGGALILAFGADWIDPVISLAVVVLILSGTWGILTEALKQALDAVPAGIDPAGVRDYLRSRPGVMEVHDLHVWGLSAAAAILTAHLVIPDGFPGDAFLDETGRGLHERFGIEHITLQIESRAEDDPCRQRECVVE